LAGLTALAAWPRAFAQASGLKLRKLHSFEIRVTDVGRAVEFYQGLFGLPVQARSNERVSLRIGEGPQFMAIRRVLDGETPAITQLGYAIEDYDLERAQAALRGVGFMPIDAPPLASPGIEHAMRTWVRTRGESRELYFADAQGLIVQLSSASYCGGAGVNGDRCGTVEAAPQGRLRLQDLNHFPAFVGDGAGANRFYQDTFGLTVQAYQGPGSPVTGIGDGRQFVMYAGGGGGRGRGGAGAPAATPANIHHGSFNMYDFDVDRVLATLTDYGLQAQERATGPLVHYVSRRMPERGGAEGGTPELYFTDPDGILMQLQDVSYCGGGGYLGNECLSSPPA
jgi:catechol 2,3-dioxygenase-like lactoylglutathione lyase family enzyme